ncbi:voltage-gated shaker-like K+ channel, subunit beta/KCNAB [Aspergillus oryzae 3.042]|uniref:Voltage-gated shaker-like K+ channel, subunit beta/KCNAB n=1 Tax=Aspergillus oryzae (strain 3.042) TaxID=1160506 RepID=I8U5Q1_ASPO3|nr:voltage-gated shaker-like K+ channel, subunit beta/KCNAB [Aspergillus oryzae 3.042]|eukprot:EIT82230.1 voltage-gated shaker-like K+ channel, subunit beta/KCNAB [Aspergillus oryzae 3.042]
MSSQPLLARYRQLAPSASVRVSPLCLGAMTFGTASKERYGECSKDATFEILDYFVSQGGNFIDTANAYREEQSEIWLGEWLASRQNRDQMVIATKYTTGWQGHHKDKIQANYGGNGTKSMRISLEASLRKLQTTYIDLFYVHWWDYTVSIPELMHSLNDLVVSGKVLYLGISDTPAWVVAKANQYARDHGLRQFTVYQGMWNAAMRDFERDIIPMCRDEGMGLCPYGVLNQGRFQTEEGFKEREKRNDGRNFIPLSEHDKKVSRVLEDVANAKGVELLQVALAYVLQKTPYVFPIVGARKVEHIKGVVPAVGITLTTEEIEKIESAYTFDPGFPHTFLSGTLFGDGAPQGAYGPGDVWLTKPLGTFDWVGYPEAIVPTERK